MRSITRNLIATLLLLLTVAPPAQAVFNMFGRKNTGLPGPGREFPWVNVGTNNAVTCGVTYLRNGWVISANHCGTGNPYFSGVQYMAEAGAIDPYTDPTVVRRFPLKKEDGVTDCIAAGINHSGLPVGIDLVIWKLQTIPPSVVDLDLVELVEVAEDIVIVGYTPFTGQGALTTCTGYIPTYPYTATIPAWSLILQTSLLTWGTNKVDPFTAVRDTRCDDNSLQHLPRDQNISSVLSPVGDPSITSEESATLYGDSGGPIFVYRAGKWRIAGTVRGGYGCDDVSHYMSTTQNSNFTGFRDGIKGQIDNIIGDAVVVESRRRCSQ